MHWGVFLRRPQCVSTVCFLGCLHHPGRQMLSRGTRVSLQPLLAPSLATRAIAQQVGISPRTDHQWLTTG